MNALAKRLCGRKVVIFALVVALAVLLGFRPVERRLRAAELLAGLGAAERAHADLGEEELSIDGPEGPIRARLYTPLAHPDAPGLVLGHGVHYRSIDEQRLVPFARELSRAGYVVLTPELRDIANYRISKEGVDTIEAAVDWLSNRMHGDPVGVLGFSFAGGLSLIAASREPTRDHVAFVGSIGGHHDLGRVLHMFVEREIETTSGRVPLKPHEYGLVVLVYGYLDRVLPREDREALRAAFRAWLQGNREEAAVFASRRLTAEGERLFELLEQGRLHELGPRLETLLSEDGTMLAALSPHRRLGQVKAPVFLLHGAHDTVIPPSETEWAALELDGQPHRALVTPLIGHVEVDSHELSVEELKLIEFIAALL